MGPDRKERGERAPPLQDTTPYRILWYLLACIFYRLLIPLYDVSGTFSRFETVLKWKDPADAQGSKPKVSQKESRKSAGDTE
jgi:hypothetical protein